MAEESAGLEVEEGDCACDRHLESTVLGQSDLWNGQGHCWGTESFQTLPLVHPKEQMLEFQIILFFSKTRGAV